MAKFSVEVVNGSFDTARARYMQEGSPPLIIAELRSAEGALEQIDGLAEVCQQGTNLIVLGPDNNVDLFRALLKRGVADYVLSPPNVGRLVDAVNAVFSDPSTTPIGKVIAFIGAKGGAGSSVVAHNAAFAIANLTHDDVTVIDLDVPFGSSDVNFNRDAPQGVRQALADPTRLDEVLLQRFMVNYGEHVQVLSAAPSLEGDHYIDPRALEALIEIARRNAPWVILDLPHIWLEWVRQALLQADDIVVTATPDLCSLRNTRNLNDFLVNRRTNDRHPFLVLNRIGGSKSDISPKEFGAAVGVMPSVALNDEPSVFAAAANNGQMVEEVGARSKTAEALRKFAQTLTGREPVVKKKAASGGLSLFRSKTAAKG